jgi:hypothetical protein
LPAVTAPPRVRGDEALTSLREATGAPPRLDVTPASRAPRTDGALRIPSPRLETPARDEEAPLRTDELPRLGAATLLRLDERLLTELLRLGLLYELLERLLLYELRLDEEPLYELRLDEELLERLPLNELPDELRLLLIELLWLPPPPRLPPPRCANAGVALSARATIASAITFEVFMMLLLSLFIVFLFCFYLHFLTSPHSPHSRVLFLLQKYNLSPREIPKPSPIFPDQMLI